MLVASVTANGTSKNLATDFASNVFPQPVVGEDFTGYTLPHEMSYYNPIGANSELQIERFEQYFLDCFNKADEDENIDFSQYEHFMFIHAGVHL